MRRYASEAGRGPAVRVRRAALAALALALGSWAACTPEARAQAGPHSTGERAAAARRDAAGAAVAVPSPGRPEPLTLAAALEAALEASPGLAAARAQAEGADAAQGEARALFFPWLSTDGAANRFEEPMVVAPFHGLDLQNPQALPRFERGLVQASLTLSWTLFDGGTRRARYRRADALAGAASHAVSAAEADLVASVARAYLRVRSTREVVDAASRRLAALQAEHDRAQRMLAEGKVAAVAVVRAEAARARARADSVAAAADVQVAERALARLMGQDASAVRERALAPVRVLQRPAVDRSALLHALESRSPELEQARRRWAAAQAGQAEARAAWLPRLQVLGRFVEYGSSAGDFTGEWQGGVQLSYPIFAGGARLSGARRADAEARAARAQVDAVKLRLEDALDRAVAAVESAAQRVAALEAAVRQSEEVARIEKLALDAGAGTQTDYLAAEAQLYEARAALTEARYAEVGARIEVARVTGELTRQWIERNLESGS